MTEYTAEWRPNPYLQSGLVFNTPSSDVECYDQLWVPKVPSGRSHHAHSIYIDHQIVGNGGVKFALTDLCDIGKYVAQIIADPQTLNRHVLVYTDILDSAPSDTAVALENQGN
ncbi:uncharacterized protein BP01DRAFT_393290 [Aspergillus saccharolyticus JOP 1030-1]|uniref:Uncharacterized protein n=1 Tax=Aspergillus saccharolyticus JOP 1030-1 TaxID=1450539 RepID=A0A318Z927_9EURO|nr:hypothetical protein BP01DRAFT_393290 [Aspergillus saccharolyticus JOP 1030-1]PYH43699.1 hypothetical protein BP01DRAFT_393290 [Aspergillus saccharolyticus JOP 1030-1]